MNSYLLILLGILTLVAGAELLVRGASKLAVLAGISPLVIGLTVVAYGTSTPELAVNMQAVLNGQPDILVGNVVGSNVFNILLILGCSAVIIPLGVKMQLIRLDLPVMIIAAILMFVFSLDLAISRTESIIFLAGILTYTVFLVLKSRKETKAVKDEFEKEYGQKKTNKGPWFILSSVLFVAAGLVLLIYGSRWLVEGATSIALKLGLSELVISLTIVAAGTSMPELATSVVAAIKGERDIAVGNVVGSNIFNVLMVIGLPGLISAESIQISLPALNFDIPFMIAVSLACLPVFFTGSIISRKEGIIFVMYYIVYTVYLLSYSGIEDHEHSHLLTIVLFSLPLIITAFGLFIFRRVKKPRKHKLTDN